MIKTMLERLLGHLHRAVFDTTADQIAAFYLDGPAGWRWDAQDENFDVFDAKGVMTRIDLNKHTMNTLAAALTALGMKVTRLDYDTRHYSGITMLELEGKAGKPQPVMIYKDILHAIFGAYSREMRAAATAVDEGIKQLVIPTANDGFLNDWGRMFGVPRGNKDDTDYRIDIPREAFRLRVNGYAIEQAVLDQTGYNITLEEPWRNIFRLDESQISGTNRFYNGDDIGYFLVQPVSLTYVDWDLVIPIIKRNLAAGIVLLPQQVRGVFLVNDPLAGNIWWQNWGIYGTWVKTDKMPRLDNEIVLSGDYEFVFNYPVSMETTYSLDNRGSQLQGTIKYDPSQVLSFYAESGLFPIGEWHTTFYEMQFLQMYPTEPRTWMIGGWDLDATWEKPYDWKVWARLQTSGMEQYLADASGIMPTITVASTQGESWSDITWNDEDWTQGS